MNFDTPVFISCFLPLIAGLYVCLRRDAPRKALLLTAGLLFYAFGSLSGLLILLLTALADWLLGKLIAKHPGSRVLFAAVIADNLLMLGFFKYLRFFFTGILLLPEPQWSPAAPLGISFFIFKAISYLADLRKDPGKKADHFWEFLLYLSFFPQVLAGPITRYDDFSRQLHAPIVMQSHQGLRRFIIGLGKKVLLAAPLGVLADGCFGASALGDIRLGWLGAVSYMLQIYFDFSGYSDMAIGLGQLFGFAAGENFSHPYAAVTITDFWRRWHISLSSWFRDYLYIPLGGNRKGKLRAACNKLIVFTLCGLWHGAAWTFVLWGLWHGLLSAAETLRRPNPKGLFGKTACRAYTLLAVMLGFVMFRAGSVGQGFAMMASLFSGGVSEAGSALVHTLLSGEAIATLLAAAVLCQPVVKKFSGSQRWELVSYPVCIVLFVLCLLRLAAGGFAPFIYLQF